MAEHQGHAFEGGIVKSDSLEQRQVQQLMAEYYGDDIGGPQSVDQLPEPRRDQQLVAQHQGYGAGDARFQDYFSDSRQDQHLMTDNHADATGGARIEGHLHDPRRHQQLVSEQRGHDVEADNIYFYGLTPDQAEFVMSERLAYAAEGQWPGDYALRLRVHEQRMAAQSLRQRHHERRMAEQRMAQQHMAEQRIVEQQQRGYLTQDQSMNAYPLAPGPNQYTQEELTVASRFRQRAHEDRMAEQRLAEQRMARQQQRGHPTQNASMDAYSFAPGPHQHTQPTAEQSGHAAEVQWTGNYSPAQRAREERTAASRRKQQRGHEQRMAAHRQRAAQDERGEYTHSSGEPEQSVAERRGPRSDLDREIEAWLRSIPDHHE